MGLLLVQGLLPAATVLLTPVLVDALVAAVGSGIAWETVGPILVPALLMAGVILLGDLLGSLSHWVKTVQSERVQDHIRDLIHARSVAADLAFYDSADFFTHLHRARNDAAHRPLALLDNLGSLAQSTVTLAAMAFVLLAYGLWLPFVLLVSVAPGLGIVLHYRRRQRAVWLHTTAGERRALYYDWLLTAREAAAELRLFDLGGQFRAAFRRERQKVREERLRLIAAENWAKLGVSVFALLVVGLVMAHMIGRVLQGTASLGDLALFFQAFHQGQGLLRTLLNNLGELYGNSLFLADLFEFLTLEPQMTEPAEPAHLPRRPATAPGPHVRFDDLRFAYPHGHGEALSGLSLEIPAGQIAAIVGPNGAGKSTLVKLLCRFYDPASGSVTLDGVDVRTLTFRELRNNISVLFQEPVQYNATVAENISLDFALAPCGTCDGAKETADVIKTATRAAGAEGLVSRLTRGYATPLGVWFDGGTDLSTGEWQRIALARAFLRQAPIIVLDEPTSAMDSWAEADWLRRFRTLAAGRTVLVITHRFTTAMLADAIHVVENGRIVEWGSHADLLALGGRYAQSWQAQMCSQTRR